MIQVGSFFIEVMQLINEEGFVEIDHHHFASLIAIVGLGNDHRQLKERKSVISS